MFKESYKEKTRKIKEAIDKMCNVIEYHKKKSKVEALAEGKEADLLEGKEIG